ncbi:hypothetical protein POTOM_008175 [Populus tomentosa]|uniref:Histone deacetylase complex subunit SAP30 Sin3 binding domain-containing protein n=1 Tax=Populus tomentosa TaxID=118781 RepID=A0A8X8AE02_POPTO|nr:hypothetical protein POTOM_008175 [Populus tomentosa]
MLETMESSVNGGVVGGFSHLQSCGDSSEEELSVLPRHTKVVVTGNNRTKSVLVGLQGVVKKAVGLGGWHWLVNVMVWEDEMTGYRFVRIKELYVIKSLNSYSCLNSNIGLTSLPLFLAFCYLPDVYRLTHVLTNGIEVKLQRNALSVIEAPTGNEEDDDLEFENVQWNGLDMGELASDDTQKSHRSRNRTHKSTGSSHKTMSRSLSCDSQSKGSISTPRGTTKVDLSKLEVAALWRYWRHFNLVDSIPNPSKEQLIDVVQRHFMSQQMDELQVIVGFVQAAKRLKTVCK